MDSVSAEWGLLTDIPTTPEVLAMCGAPIHSIHFEPQSLSTQCLGRGWHRWDPPRQCQSSEGYLCAPLRPDPAQGPRQGSFGRRSQSCKLIETRLVQLRAQQCFPASSGPNGPSGYVCRLVSGKSRFCKPFRYASRGIHGLLSSVLHVRHWRSGPSVAGHARESG